MYTLWSVLPTVSSTAIKSYVLIRLQYTPLCMLSGTASLLCWMDGISDCTTHVRGMAGLSGFIPESDFCSAGIVVAGAF
jgi:hypothetical protein